MSSIALVTPTYPGDLERCAFLCESVDSFVSGYSKHYLIVRDDCLKLFAHFAGPRRAVLPASEFLPRWLKSMPHFVKRKGRQYWWSLRVPPADGWQVQQLLKIAAACSLPEERYCMLDSDIVFFRPFDLAAYARPEPLRLYRQPTIVAEALLPHAPWVRATHTLLDLGTAVFPGHDFVTHIVFWDQRTARAMVERIAAVSGTSWFEALCRARYHLSEYMLYGYFVMTNDAHGKDHWLCDHSLCKSYFDTEPLKQAAALEMLRGSAGKVGFSVVSRSHTPLALIRQILQSKDWALQGGDCA
jgi:hypothetical protein